MFTIPPCSIFINLQVAVSYHKINQKVIESLLKVALLCGKQGLAFRGHRDEHVDCRELEEDRCSNKCIWKTHFYGVLQVSSATPRLSH